MHCRQRIAFPPAARGGSRISASPPDGPSSAAAGFSAVRDLLRAATCVGGRIRISSRALRRCREREREQARVGGSFLPLKRWFAQLLDWGRAGREIWPSAWSCRSPACHCQRAPTLRCCGGASGGRWWWGWAATRIPSCLRSRPRPRTPCRRAGMGSRSPRRARRAVRTPPPPRLRRFPRPTILCPPRRPLRR